MIDFKPVTLSDREWIERCLRVEDSRSSDFNFTNILLWGEDFGLKAALVCDRLAFRSELDGVSAYSFPVGPGDMRAAVLELTRDAQERGDPFILQSITADNAEKIDILFPCLFDFEPDRDYFDYVYSAERLAAVSGKHLHAKRNFINRFEMENKWSFEPISASNLALCRQMNEEWIHRHVNEENISEYRGELKAIEKAFSYFEQLRLEGGLLRAGDRVVAFTVGEMQSSDTYIVHFEKAFADIDGAYPMINREFVKYVLSKHPETVYINREDDTGSMNLRKAKLSYLPDFMVEKFTARPKRRCEVC